MLQSTEYMLAWGVYLLGALALWVCWWRLTAWLPFVLVRQVLRALLVAVLIAPAPVIVGEPGQAPAAVLLLLDKYLAGEQPSLRALENLGLAFVLALVYVAVEMGLRFWWSRRSDTASTAT